MLFTKLDDIALSIVRLLHARQLILLMNIFRKIKYSIIFLVTIIMVTSTSSLADIQQLDSNLFVAGVQSNEFEYFTSPQIIGRQRQSNWCWAASIQMVLNYHGLYVRQEEIVQRIYGQQTDQPANPNQILAALSGWAPDTRGRYSTIHASPYVLSGNQIVQDLAQKWPMIVGLQNPGAIGHAVVLTAIIYSVDRFNNPVFHGVVIRDPWPGSASRQELSWDEFQSRLNFIARVYVQRL